MKRREVITLVGGAATWPLVARAQQRERMQRIGVLMNKAETDPEGVLELAAFGLGLQERGWTADSTLKIEYRWGAGDATLYRKYSAELVGIAPDAILAVGGTAVGALQQVTRTLPIVFVEVTDPVNRGLIASLASPGGNATGFTEYEFSLSGKWVELLKETDPRITRAAVIRDPVQFSGIGQLTAVQTVAATFGIDIRPVDARDSNEIDRAITELARAPGGGMIVTASGSAIAHRDLLITLAVRHKLPAIYPYRYYVGRGGLVSYGPDPVRQFRSAAGYIDRILKGQKPAELPVQAPTKYELAINLKTAKALGLELPPMLLARADEVIE